MRKKIIDWDKDNWSKSFNKISEQNSGLIKVFFTISKFVPGFPDSI